MEIFFTISLILLIYFVIDFSFTEQDTLLDAHENYYYSQMVLSWGTPPDTTKMLEDIQNLKMHGGVYKDSVKIWSYPKEFSNTEYLSYSDSEILGEIFGMDIPLYVSFGDMGELPATYVNNEDYDFYLVIDYHQPSDFLMRFIPASILTSIFVFILFLVIRSYLKPIQLMKNRALALEKGDLQSTIPIIGEDELADLSVTINKMISDIRTLLGSKQQLLADVSHELRSPLTRMKLLIEMLPEHKNIHRLKEQVGFLESMITNLLISDRLSSPYKNLDIEEKSVDEIMGKVIAMFPNSESRISVIGQVPDQNIFVDNTKISLALRNIIDNALRYGGSDRPVQVSCGMDEKHLIISVRDFGVGISPENISKITEPFYRIKSDGRSTPMGFGLGLSITQKIVEAHGGKLKIESKVGINSEFSILLPKGKILRGPSGDG